MTSVLSDTRAPVDDDRRLALLTLDCQDVTIIWSAPTLTVALSAPPTLARRRGYYSPARPERGAERPPSWRSRAACPPSPCIRERVREMSRSSPRGASHDFAGTPQGPDRVARH